LYFNSIFSVWNLSQTFRICNWHSWVLPCSLDLTVVNNSCTKKLQEFDQIHSDPDKENRTTSYDLLSSLYIFQARVKTFHLQSNQNPIKSTQTSKCVQTDFPQPLFNNPPPYPPAFRDIFCSDGKYSTAEARQKMAGKCQQNLENDLRFPSALVLLYI
jgi:hypothetical protein